MSEERETAPVETGKSSALGKLVRMLAVVVLSAGGGIAAYKLWLEPRLSPPAANAEEDERIPKEAQAVPFDDFMVTVLQPDKSKPAPLLLFSISLLCANPETAHLIEKDQAYFKDMINRLHSYKARAELDDPLAQENLKKEVLRLANERLVKLQLKPSEEVKVLEVFHTKFAVVDQQ
jgi:flagellar basal body-associated protein FliL